jgi:hypothetical protein
VIQFRFARFYAVFGRKPRRDECLFFDPGTSAAPVLASDEAVLAQIAEAANACDVDLGLVLNAFGLTSIKERDRHADPIFWRNLPQRTK